MHLALGAEVQKSKALDEARDFLKQNSYYDPLGYKSKDIEELTSKPV